MARPSLVQRIRALTEAADHAEGRVADELVQRARDVARRAEGRLAITGDATVVAVAGATGSGKSSTVNALAGTEVSAPGVRRPTTSHAVAAVFGATPATELLDWLDIRARHQIAPVEGSRGSRELVPKANSRAGSRTTLDGLVLLDLPDHDSTQATHRAEVDRLVDLVDMVIWVVDPQKYADAALHEQYLVPLARHAATMVVLLNQVDRLTPDERVAMTADLKRLLRAEGLGTVEVLGVSATTGEGLEAVRDRLAREVKAKLAATRRFAADVGAAATALRDACVGTGSPVAAVTAAQRSRLDAALATAAGVPVVTEAVGQAWRRRGGLATGWPVLAWIARFRPDPLRRLHLDRLGVGRRKPEIDPARVARTSLPATTSVQQARVDSAVRDLVDEVSDGLPRGWVTAVREASRRDAGRLPDRLDRAIATTDLDLERHRRWWQVVRVLQWLLVLVVVGGLGWLALDLVLAYLRLPPLPEMGWQLGGGYSIPVPTLMVLGGVGSGLVVAAVSRIGVEVGARRRSRRAESRLTRSVGAVTTELVVDPVNAELRRHGAAVELLDTAVRDSRALR